MVHTPFRACILKGWAVAVSSSKSITSSDCAMFGSVNPGKKLVPRPSNAAGVVVRGAVTHASVAKMPAMIAIMAVLRASVMSRILQVFAERSHQAFDLLQLF